jgi:protein-S-isoprenylcysteine O-methyltransferase Ste14
METGAITLAFDTYTAIVLITSLAIFVLLNALNLWKSRKIRKFRKYYAETLPPKGLIFTITAIGTFVFWFECIIYPLSVFANFSAFADEPWFNISIPFSWYLRVVGIIILVIGFAIFDWSIIVRGRYATSWKMAEDHKLVTWGPYRYVRHPSYLSYFLMFLGMFLLRQTIIALIPIIAIPGYILLSEKEEKLLIQRFGKHYLEYMKHTGKFVPKIKKNP